MSQRERILAVVVGVMLLLVPVIGGFSWVTSRVRAKRDQADALKKSIFNKELTIVKGQRASERILRYESQSLPPDRELARGQYQSWLFDLAEDSGFQKTDVRLQAGTPGGDVYFRFKFFVSGVGNIEELTQFLHRFY